MALNYVSVSGTIAPGAKVVFVMSGWQTDPADELVVPPRPVTASCGANSEFTGASLLANDNADIPAGSYWTVTVSGIAGVPINSWTVLVDYANGASQDLSQLVQVSPTSYSAYLPMPAGTPVAGYVPVATGSGEASAWGLVASDAYVTAAVAAETARAEAAEAALLPMPAGTPVAGYVPVATGSGEASAWGLVASDAYVTAAVAAETARAEAAEAALASLFPSAAQLGIVAENYPPVIAQSATASVASGVPILVRVPLPGTPVTITNLLYCIDTAGVSLTSGENFAGLLDNNGSRIGVSADQSTSWNSVGFKTSALAGGPFSGSWPFVFAVFLPNAGTGPQFLRGAGSIIGPSVVCLNSSGSNMPFATNGSGQTSVAASYNYSNNAVSGAYSIWVGLS